MTDLYMIKVYEEDETLDFTPPATWGVVFDSVDAAKVYVKRLGYSLKWTKPEIRNEYHADIEHKSLIIIQPVELLTLDILREQM